MMETKTKSRLTNIAFGVAATIAFGIAAYSMIRDRSATASVAATFMLALLLFQQLPIVESLEVLTLKVKLTNRIGEAEKLLDHIKTSANVSAKLMLVELAFMNRMGSISWSMKRDMLHDIDSMLSSVGVSIDEIEAIKRPFLNMVSFDLCHIFDGSLRILLQRRQRAASDELRQYQAGKVLQANDPTYLALVEKQRQLAYSGDRFEHALTDPRLADVDALTAGWLADAPLPQDEKDQLETIRREVSDLSRSCWQAGTVTPAAEDYLNRYGERADTRLNELSASD